MKFSDLMLDMATGDASMEDAYIQEAVGKINVSHAFFEASYKIYELPEDEEFMIVQEAAEAGLPTETGESAALANESVVQELGAFYDLIVATAKKVKMSADKDFKALAGLGKGIGVSMGGDITTFAQNLANAVVNGRGKRAFGSIELGSRKFLAPMYIKKLTKKYAQGMAKYLGAYGISIADAFGDETVRRYVGTAGPVKENGGMHAVATGLSNGTGQIIDKGSTTEHGNKFRTNINARDIIDLVCCIHVVRVISDAVIQTASNKGTKKNAMATISALMAGPNGKGRRNVSSAAHDIDATIKYATPKLTNDVVKNIVTGYTDSVYALVEISNGGRAPLPKKASADAE
jgi:hypothetical protein